MGPIHRHIIALRTLFNRLEDTNITWVLVGGLNSRSQGLPMIVEDIDILTDFQEAHLLEHLFRDNMITPSAFLCSERIRSHLCSLFIDVVRVEIRGDVRILNPDSTWGTVDDVNTRSITSDVEGMKIPGRTLEAGYYSYERMGREKSGPDSGVVRLIFTGRIGDSSSGVVANHLKILCTLM